MESIYIYIRNIFEFTSLWWTNVMVGGTCEKRERLKGLMEERTSGDVWTQFLFFTVPQPKIFIKLDIPSKLNE